MSQLKIMYWLSKKGYRILLPFGDNYRYDLVVETPEGFNRVQCKTGRLSNGAIEFPVASSAYHRGGSRKTYDGEIDSFGIYCPGNQKCYLVPIEALTLKNQCSLRITPPANKQSKNIRWAANFELV